MTSYLTDLVLMAALIVTSWRTWLMYRELRRLRSGKDGLGEALQAADRSIGRAAHAVVALKSEGVETLRALETENAAARELAERLEQLVARAEWHCGTRPARDAAMRAPFPEPSTPGLDRGSHPVSRQPRPLGIGDAACAAA